ncbi:MAG: LON peptidase substrate-binding domain-containing protein, partial [Clostridia bacterium]|nr:LON peptidase substrate-binding domain-containing protein [Clostridia bacterium]
MNQVIMKQTSALPMIILRGLVVFPNTLLHFDMARKKSILALENAMLNQQLAFVTAQMDASIENPTPKDIEKMGTICRITQVVKMPNNMVRVLVEGIKRAEISEILKVKPYFVSLVDEIEPEENDDTDLEKEALRRRLLEEFNRYRDANKRLGGEVISIQQHAEDAGRLADNLAANLPLSLSDKQDILNTV